MIRNALFLCVVCALVFVFYLPSYVKMQDMNEKNRQYEKRIGELAKDNARLEEERRRLVEDPVYFEKVAREKMGIIRDGEVLYKIVGPGHKKGVVSEEASFIIKKPEDDAGDAAAKPAVRSASALKAVVKATPRTAARKTTGVKVSGTRTSTKVDPKPVVKKTGSVKVKKNTKISASKETIHSTN